MCQKLNDYSSKLDLQVTSEVCKSFIKGASHKALSLSIFYIQSNIKSINSTRRKPLAFLNFCHSHCSTYHIISSLNSVVVPYSVLPYIFSLPIFISLAAITKHHKLGGFNSRNLFSHGSEDEKSLIKVPINLFPGETSPPVLQMATFLLVLMWPLFCAQAEREL